MRPPGSLPPGLGQGEQRGGQVSPGGEEGGRPAPGEIVVVGVEEPGAGPAAETEDEAGGEHDEPHQEVTEHSPEEEVVAKPQPDVSGGLKDSEETEEPGEAAEDETETEEALDCQQPGRHQPLPDLVVGPAPHAAAAVEQDVKLEPREPEPVEADLPGAHPDEGRLSVLPGDLTMNTPLNA